MPNSFKWEIDPASIDESLRRLGARLQQYAEQAQYTRVRFSYRGRQVLPDLPLAAVIAAEGLSLAVAGPLWLLIGNLGVKAFVEVEFIHEASEKVAEGMRLFNEGEVDAAEEKYREALRMKPDDTSALYNLGVLLRVTGRRDEAVAAFEAAAKDGGHPDAARAKEALERMRRGSRTL
jgi:tetratricopeptide (TPR) repeat protein